MHLSWEDLQTIESLVRTGSVVGAARELGLRHSSISRRVDALERSLAEPLFLRGPRLRPTTLATAIAARATAMAKHAHEIEALIEGERRARELRLVMTTNDVLAPLVFTALAGHALEETVQVRVSDVEAELAPGTTDLALRPGGQPSGALRGWRLGRLRVGIFRARSGQHGARTWILPSADLRKRSSMRWWKAVPDDAEGRVECNSLLSMRDACIAGLGRAALPSLLAAQDTRLQLEEEIDGGPPVWLLAPATRRADARRRRVAQLLVSSIRSARGVWVT